MNPQIIFVETKYQNGMQPKDLGLILEKFSKTESIVPVEFHIEPINSYYGFFDGSVGEDGLWKNDIYQFMHDILIRYSLKKDRTFEEKGYKVSIYNPTFYEGEEPREMAIYTTHAKR